jgi:CRP-like cAMP-binding protein
MCPGEARPTAVDPDAVARPGAGLGGLDGLARVARRIAVGAGCVVQRDGESPSRCLFVLAGSAAVVDARRIVALLGPGDAHGVPEALDGTPPRGTVVATTSTEVLTIEATRFAELVAASEPTRTGLLRHLGIRLRQVTRATAARSRP